MRISILHASALCILPFAAATTCDLSNALTYSDSGSSGSSSSSGSSDDSPPGSSSGSSSSDPCVQECGNDSACLQTCYEIAQQGQCNSVGCPDSGDSDDGSGDDVSDLIKRATSDTLDCTSSQTCYLYTNGVLFCLNNSTGDFVDQYGGTGNMDSDIYTEPNGQVTTVPSDKTGSTATRSVAVTTTRSSDAATTSDASTASTRSSNTASSPASATSNAETAATSTAAARHNMEVPFAGPGIAVGVMGLIMGIFA